MHVLQTLLLVWSLAPLVFMLAALGYASWLREGRREAEAVAPASPRDHR